MAVSGIDLDRLHYTDREAVRLVPGPPQPALTWARAILEDAPPGVRRFLRVSWRWGLLIPLGPVHGPGHVLGWPVADTSTDSLTVLAARSRLGLDTRLAISTDADELVFRTFIRYAHRGAAAVWFVVAPVHRLIVQRLLAAAVRRSRPG
jgi:hypothetical protein